MNWIKIEDREPKEDQLVLVKGMLTDELNSKPQNSIGFVNWYNRNISYCKDNCHYSVWYTDITEWCEVIELTN